jgi:hypothetical protein
MAVIMSRIPSFFGRLSRKKKGIGVKGLSFEELSFQAVNSPKNFPVHGQSQMTTPRPIAGRN